MWEVIVRGMPLVCLLACSSPAARVQLVPIELPSSDPDNPCGKPAASTVSSIRVIAYTPSGELRRTDSEISDFPADTEQLGIELVGNDGTVLATGKTAPLVDYGDLATGAQIPVAVLPPNGFCRTNDMTEARVHPLVATAGTGVLVVGGAADSSAELYDPATATFTAIPLPGVLATDASALVGASIASLADGRVVVSNGQVLIVFDPAKGLFDDPQVVTARTDHASLGLDASHVLLTGGCLPGACTTPLRSSLAYQLDGNGAIVGDGVVEPSLPTASVRYGGTLIDLGVISDGSRRLVLAGATSDPTTADQLPITTDVDADATTATGMHAQVAQLDGGAILAAFELDGSPQTGDASVLPPEASAAAAIALAPAWDGARLVVAEDGSALAIGGDAEVARYSPTTSTWDTHTPGGDAPGSLAGPSLIRLADGSVLVLGDGSSTASAWLYRPSLVGPASGQVVALPDGTSGILTPSDPTTATLAASTLTLTAPADDLTARALVGGPRIATGTLTAAIRVPAGGVALIAQQTAPARALVARLVPGEATRIERHVGADVTTLCTGDDVTSDELATGVVLAVTDDTVTASVGPAGSSTVKVSCGFSADPIAAERGQWGIAATAAGMVEVATVTVAR
jgi:hypothetical protein